ncbi:MAG TPA: crossover junction endodeoxyribonuclease RuvC [Candidatus Fimimonas merdipullorum]|uniref:Crossover junction endodeoxyribonuclease RuvC n=1 Tax=Candidatus Fimimonas merdipullorum TaxID=2840822 RepID=A0A9D1SQ27_9BACT|nr:crossover junction endodeoxyribonuclease RuvC [Candidatus Fimimonas merdipullorum]
MKRVIGFDPGFAIVGYGVLDYEDFRNIKVVDYGVITTPKEESFPVRLAIIYKGVQELIKKYNPDEVAVEELFFNTNITTGINVAHARGVLLLAAIHHCGNLYEYTPLQIKQAMTGYGKATKKQIQEMVKTYLSLAAVPKPDDAADALAVALTHAQTGGFTEKFYIR